MPKGTPGQAKYPPTRGLCQASLSHSLLVSPQAWGRHPPELTGSHMENETVSQDRLCDRWHLS